jgi:hypothetical protein
MMTTMILIQRRIRIAIGHLFWFYGWWWCVAFQHNTPYRVSVEVFPLC